MTTEGGGARLPVFAAVYLAATFGAFLCFIPLIGLILPQRVSELAPAGSVDALSRILFAGGIASSLGNIVGGWSSDRLVHRHGTRFPLIGVGLVATLVSFAAMAMAASTAALLFAFVVFQLAFNLLFAPLVAVASDHVADAHKGRLFGWLSLGMPAAQGVTTLLALSSVEGIGARLALMGMLVAISLMPLLVIGPRVAGARIAPRFHMMSDPAQQPSGQLTRSFAYAWISRFLIQCSGVAVGSYLLIHLQTLSSDLPTAASADEVYGRILAWSLVGATLTGPLAGYLSDRTGYRLALLLLAILLVAAGCGVIATAGNADGVAVGYCVFAIGLSGFLALDGAIIAQIVGQGDARGTMLGVLNLTNTLPAILVPALLIVMGGVNRASTTTLFWMIAGAALLGLASASRINSIR